MNPSQKEFLLNAFASYIRQTAIATKGAVTEAYRDHPELTEKLLAYFVSKFDPDNTAPKEALERAEAEISEKMPKNPSLKAVFSALKAMVRTNFFQNGKDYVSFKFISGRIPGLPKPVPMAEIFVYSDAVDAVHLRFGKIARGGIRWSDRKDDFRTEILSLVKAQQVKNVVIVPVGSKGGFFPKRPPEGGDKAAIVANAVECYKTLIRGMLDITDNIVGGQVVRPDRVVCYDGEDPYLVVAADKGTAEFSDYANALSAEYGFWLGDAFASGGSAGYNHKGMAITAKGSWESVKRHFAEMGRDCQSEDFTCVGVGSMAGDVYGNAMLLSRRIKLIAAVNHSNIFIDPNPDTEVSFKERERLFKEEAGWSAYDRSLLSAGGAVYDRREKSVSLSDEACKALGTSKKVMTPDELVKTILKAPVDLLYFGGIGTYVKSSSETQPEAKDAANASCRIDANELRAKAVAEGANLGLTQRARIEYALNGGRLNTDAVDNSGGVDCSDHEVNIKIMLNAAMAEGRLSFEARNALLKSMTDDVAELVLKDNYQQNRIISYMSHRGAKSIPGNKKLMARLEKSGRLDRALEFLPTDVEMDARFDRGLGLTRPELCVLMAYAKMALYDHILNSDLPDDPVMAEGVLLSYFPKALREGWRDDALKHPLRREIASTVLANNMVNRVSVNFVGKMRQECSASVAEVAKAYLVTAMAYDTESLFALVEAKSGKISAEEEGNLTRRLVLEIENMVLTLLRRGLEGSVREEARILAARPDEKFASVREALSV